MKKILFTLLLILVIPSVHAETYYTDYSDWSDWSTTVINSDDITDVETQKRYKYYNDKVTNGEYFLEGENTGNYKLLDKNDYKLSKQSEWSTTYPEKKDNRVIYSRTVYSYKKHKGVNMIMISNYSFEKLYIGEINIYSNNELIMPIDSLSLYCSSHFFDKISNKLNDNDIYIDSGGYIKIILDKFYPIDSLIIKITTPFNNTEVSYGIQLYYYDGDISRIVQYEKHENQNKSEYNYTYKDMDKKQIVMSDEIIESVVELDHNLYEQESSINEYSYIDRYYKYNMVESQYSDYLLEPTKEYTIKSDQYKDYYRYRKRKKIEITELELERNDVINKINDIENKIVCEDNVNKYNDLINELNDYKMQVNQLNTEISSYKNKIKKVEDEKYELTNKYENKIFNIQNSKKEEPSSVINNDNTLDVPVLSIKNNIKYIIILPIMLILSLIVYIYYKKKNKN